MRPVRSAAWFLVRHRYFHRLYALDTLLGDIGRPAEQALQAAMRGHVLAEAELVGTYARRAARADARRENARLERGVTRTARAALTRR